MKARIIEVSEDRYIVEVLTKGWFFEKWRKLNKHGYFYDILCEYDSEIMYSEDSARLALDLFKGRQKFTRRVIEVEL